MKIFDAEYLVDLIKQAEISTRKRQHRNIHLSYEDSCQRLFNAIEPESYIQPHRHTATAKDELLIAVRGLMACITFDDQGVISSVQYFGSELYGENVCAGVEVGPNTWHTVVALVRGAVLLEVKAGPFDPAHPKEYAYWAPNEGAAGADSYFAQLRTFCNINFIEDRK
jgi:cupin fold WbuC family metalloprotein